MASDKSVETRKMALTTTQTSEDFVTGVSGVGLIADADSFVDFDQPADTGSFLMKANTPVFLPVPFTRIYARASTGTANLYIIGVR